MVGHLDDRVGGENPNCAYAWLDYIASPEANAAATAYFGEAPSSEAACEFREDCEAYHAGDAEYASQIWYWTTPIAECIDGRTDVECVDYAAMDRSLAGDQGLTGPEAGAARPYERSTCGPRPHPLRLLDPHDPRSR